MEEPWRAGGRFTQESRTLRASAGLRMYFLHWQRRPRLDDNEILEYRIRLEQTYTPAASITKLRRARPHRVRLRSPAHSSQRAASPREACLRGMHLLHGVRSGASTPTEVHRTRRPLPVGFARGEPAHPGEPTVSVTVDGAPRRKTWGARTPMALRVSTISRAQAASW